MSTAACPNCGHPAEHFCPQCGQKQHDAHPTVTGLASELVTETVSLEGRLFTTLRSVLTRPGELALDFLEGRRARHISPLRLFLIVFAVFFLVSSELFDVGTQLVPALRESLEPRAAALGLTVDQLAAQKNATIIAGIKAIRAGLLIINSLWFWLLFRRQRPHYIDHLVLWLQLACFSLSLGVLTNLVARWMGTVAVDFVVLLPASATYAVLAARRVYGQPWPATIVKVSLVYLLNFATAVVAILAWAGIVLRYL